MVFLWILDPVARHGRRPQGRRVGALRQGTAFSHEKKGVSINKNMGIWHVMRHMYTYVAFIGIYSSNMMIRHDLSMKKYDLAIKHLECHHEKYGFNHETW